MKSARVLPDARSNKSRRTTSDDADHVYRVIEIVGTSGNSISDAINNAITRAHKTLRNLRWFEVIRTSGHIEGGKVRHYQASRWGLRWKNRASTITANKRTSRSPSAGGSGPT